MDGSLVQSDVENQAQHAEIVRLNKIIAALIKRAEKESGAHASHYGMFQTTVTLENQIRARTIELRAALAENEQINRSLQKEIEARELANQALAQEREEQRHLIKKLEEAHNQLLQSEKLASIGQLAAGVAHEINNPIGFVNSNLGTLKIYAQQVFELLAQFEALDCASPGEYRARIGALKEAADFEYLREDITNLITESIDGAARVRRIVQDLRDFSRPGESEWQEVDLHAGIESTLNVVWSEIKYKAEVERDFGSLPGVMCLPFQINQVLLNLFVNAAQAIQDFGRIAVRTRAEQDWVSIAVSDTGSGIPPEILGRIFDPFFTTKPVGKGTGLGLSVAYGIVRKHGGRIDVQSAPGEGTTFTIHLPVKGPATSGAA